MRIEDQYFKPGDKVMRVSDGDKRGEVHKCDAGTPQYGVVYCVESFWEGPIFNVVMLVGFGGWRYAPNGDPVGWQAIAFRKVEEIKLCLSAVQKKSQPANL